MSRRSNVDWDSVEREYRAGIRSLADIGAEYDVSAPGILKKARKEGWDRDLSAKIQAKVEAKVNAALVNKAVNADDLINERQIIEANAQTIADKVLSQQKAVKKSVAFAESLLDEAIKVGVATDDLEKLGELMAAPDENGRDKLNELYKKIISMPGRVDAGKKIIEMLKIAVELERKVLRIKDEQDPAATVVMKADPTLSPADAYMRMIGKK